MSTQRPIIFLSICLTYSLTFPLPGYTADHPTINTLALGPKIQEDLDFIKEETVLTASQYNQPISKAPSNMYVISAEDIRQSGAVLLPNLLRRVPGIEVMQMTGGEFNVSIRGNNQLRPPRLLLMIDGRSIFFDAQGGVGWTQLPITFPEIKKIEVLKGPASAVYGFNAFDGVINIITKTPQEMPLLTFQTTGGEFGTLHTSGVHAGKVNRLAYRLSAGHTQTGQWRNRDALALRVSQVNGQATYQITPEMKFLLEGGISEKNRDDFASSELFRNDSMTTKSYTRIGLEKENFFLRAYWNQFDVKSSNIPLIPFLVVTDLQGRTQGITLLSNTYDIAAQYTQTFFSNHKAIVGANYRFNTLSGSQVRMAAEEQRFGLFFQDEWQPHETFSATAGIRVDLHDEIHPTYSPRIAVFLFPHPDHTLRISGSVAYRPPTLLDANTVAVTNTVGLGPTITSTFSGTSNLDPEQMTSYEIEYQGWFAQHRLRGRGALFFNQISDLIASNTGGTTSVNNGDADIYGGEVGLEVLATPWLSGFVNYAYQNISQTFAQNQRRGAPNSKINGGIRTKFKNGLSGELLVHYVGPATYPIRPEFATFAGLSLIPASSVPNPRVESYTLVNLRGAYRFWEDKAEIAVSIYNALNDRHREHPQGDIIGSRILGWLTIHLGS